MATAKGESSGPKTWGKFKGERRRKEHPYIPTLIAGSIARFGLPVIEKQLAVETERSMGPTRPKSGKLDSPPDNPTHHVIYVIKENRTYDQILGDLPVGDGDRELAMYGADITPNHHKLALQFGVLENFYDRGEVSGNGHIWSTASITRDYNEKTWPIGYRSKERTYDSGGAVAEDFRSSREFPTSTIPALDSSGTTSRKKASPIASMESSSPLCGARARSPRRQRRRWDRRRKERRLPRLRPVGWPKSRKESLYRRTSATHAAGRARGRGRFRRSSACVRQKPRCATTTIRSFRISRPTYPDQLRADEFLREFDEFVKAEGQPPMNFRSLRCSTRPRTIPEARVPASPRRKLRSLTMIWR